METSNKLQYILSDIQKKINEASEVLANETFARDAYSYKQEIDALIKDRKRLMFQISKLINLLLESHGCINEVELINKLVEKQNKAGQKEELNIEIGRILDILYTDVQPINKIKLARTFSFMHGLKEAKEFVEKYCAWQKG